MLSPVSSSLCSRVTFEGTLFKPLPCLCIISEKRKKKDCKIVSREISSHRARPAFFKIQQCTQRLLSQRSCPPLWSALTAPVEKVLFLYAVSLLCFGQRILQSRRRVSGAPEQPGRLWDTSARLYPAHHWLLRVGAFYLWRRRPELGEVGGCCRRRDIFMRAGGHVYIHHKTQATLLCTCSLTVYSKARDRHCDVERGGEGA